MKLQGESIIGQWADRGAWSAWAPLEPGIPRSTASLPSGDPAHMPARHRPLPSSLLFGRTFLRHPRMLGSVVPSSRFLISRILRQADWARTRVVVEAGPGVGTLTTGILDRLHRDGTVVAFEMNRTFVTHLRARSSIPGWGSPPFGADADPRWRSVAPDRSTARVGHSAEWAHAAGSPGSRGGMAAAAQPGRGHGGLSVHPVGRTRPAPGVRHVRQEFEPLNVLPAWVWRCEVPA